MGWGPPPRLSAAVRRSLLITGVVVAVVVLLTAAAFAYDSTRKDEIAQGVRVGGVDLGGLTASQARAKLRDTLLEGLEAPVVVHRAGRHFRMTAGEAEVGVDISGLVDEALQRSRSGSIVSRVWRDITGSHVDASMPARVHFSRTAVADFIGTIGAAVARAPKNAELKFSGDGITKVKEERGRRLKADLLRRQIESALATPGARRSFAAHAQPIKPGITQDSLAQRNPVVITINRGAFRLKLFENLKLTKTYKIAVGQVGLETPAGLYHIQNKQTNPAWHVPNSDWAGKLAGKVIPPDDPTNPIKARWMGIYNGAGIHGTDAVGSLGSAASHGCIRMAIPDVIELYGHVPVGAPVFIA
jgi:lipoprotein-anchoring transpeptidase ErfK/SrfK